MAQAAAAVTPPENRSLSRENSLEYFIKFPTPNFRNNGESAESDYVFVYNETNVPIVILLGWAGCQDKYLMKYSKIYEDRGLITVRYTAPVENLFWKKEAMRPIGEKILRLIYDMNFDSHPIIFHVFSNGGAYLYQHISTAMRKSDKPVQVRGVIFDSAPGERHILGLFRAISAIYGKNKPMSCLLSWFISISLLILWMFEDCIELIKHMFKQGERYFGNPFQSLRDEPNSWPQMFLYSKADLLIRYKDIEKFAKHRQRRAVPVQMYCFENAEHVKLYASQPQMYVQCVCKFINDCLVFYENNKEGTKID